MRNPLLQMYSGPSYVAADKMFCVYLAMNEEAIQKYAEPEC